MRGATAIAEIELGDRFGVLLLLDRELGERAVCLMQRRVDRQRLLEARAGDLDLLGVAGLGAGVVEQPGDVGRAVLGGEHGQRGVGARLVAESGQGLVAAAQRLQVGRVERQRLIGVGERLVPLALLELDQRQDAVGLGELRVGGDRELELGAGAWRGPSPAAPWRRRCSTRRR